MLPISWIASIVVRPYQKWAWLGKHSWQDIATVKDISYLFNRCIFKEERGAFKE